MLGVGFVIIYLLAFIIISGIVFYATSFFIKNRNRRIAIGMIIAFLMCAYHIYIILVPTRI